jgi:hypothetical protein
MLQLAHMQYYLTGPSSYREKGTFGFMAVLRRQFRRRSKPSGYSLEAESQARARNLH